MEAISEVCINEWIMTIGAGVRFLGRVVKEENGVFELNPAFEYIMQVKFTQGNSPQRDEAVMALDMVGNVPLTVTPKAFFRVQDLPSWRQQDLEKLVLGGLKSAEALAARKRSGFVLVGA